MIASGIPAVGALEWGTHFCQFYETRQDLAESLVPYFKAGLDGNEKCLWVTSDPFAVDDARAMLRAVVADMDARERSGQLEIFDYRDWYIRERELSAPEVMETWIERQEQALAEGYAGLRLTGNTFWLQTPDWRSFAEYEATVNEHFAGRRMLALCSYCLDKVAPSGVLDVVRNHQFAVARRDGEWEVIEDASLKITREELRRLNLDLERRAEERMIELRRALADKDALLREVHHRVKNNLQIVSSLLHVKALHCPHDEIRQAFNDTMQRIRAMALVHEMLYRQEVSCIDFSAYLQGLVDGLVRPYQRDERVAVEVSSTGGDVNLNAAITLGMIANELISNALKHAFPDGRSGRITVSFAPLNGRPTLIVSDDGVGTPAEARSNPARGAGLYLIQALAAQLDAKIESESAGGTRIRVTLPGRGAVLQ